MDYFLFIKMFNPFQRILKRAKNDIYFQGPIIENKKYTGVIFSTYQH